MASVYLLGGGGFIGSNLARELARRNVSVVVGTRNPCAPSRLQLPERVPVQPVNLHDLDELAQQLRDHRIDTLVHLASTLGPAGDEAALKREQREITEPTKRLMPVLADLGIRLVYFSSGGTVYGPSTADRLSEAAACAPISPYGSNKYQIEAHIRAAHRSLGLRYLILRPANPYGPGQSLEGQQGLVSVVFGKLRSGHPLEVWGGESVRDYIYIDDLTDAVALLIESGIEGRTLNIGSGVGHSVLDVVDAIEAVTGRRPELRLHRARDVDVKRVVLDTQQLESLGVRAARPLESGIRAYVEWLERPHGEA